MNRLADGGLQRLMGRAYPAQPLPSCHALVRSGERICLVRRARPPLAGYWGLPGGAVELGETVEEAVQREVQEETGLQGAITRFLGYDNKIERDEANRVRYHYVVMYFEVEFTGGELTPGDDAGEVAWFTVEEARRLQLTDSVEQCLVWSQAND